MHVCACVVDGKRKLLGFNQKKTHPEARRICKHGCEAACLHAEVDALVKTSVSNKAKMFIFRFLRDGGFSMAKPCAMCHQKIIDAGLSLKNVFYTDWEGNWQTLQ